MKLALDWDGTLVDENQDWLPGALDALRWFQRGGHKIVVHSARANYEGGVEDIKAKLTKHRISAKVASKPDADLYIDNKGLRFTRWPDVIREVRSAKA